MSTDLELCVGALYHSPKPTLTQRHHIRPMYLAALLGVPIDPTVVPLCATEHDNVHHALRHLINTGDNPHRFADRTQGYVDMAWLWWQWELVG